MRTIVPAILLSIPLGMLVGAACAQPIHLTALPPPTGVTDLIYHCVTDRHSNPNKYPKCSDGIPLVVLDGGSGDCVALLPYNKLFVHTTANKLATRIRWNIVGAGGYVFMNEGVALKQQTGSTDVPTDFYDSSQLEASGRTVRIDSKDGKDSAMFDHAALVGNGGSVSCKPMDPVIVNRTD
jgi:hypothetical protein